ncbi:MAG: hypothetical protein ACOYOH_02220 [Paracraurococcus sp.]
MAALLALTLPAAAQTRLVVPDGAVVAVPARGAPDPMRPVASPRPRVARLAPIETPPAVPAEAALIPLAAAAALAAAVAGGGGGGGVSAPVRTR